MAVPVTTNVFATHRDRDSCVKDNHIYRSGPLGISFYREREAAKSQSLMEFQLVMFLRVCSRYFHPTNGSGFVTDITGSITGVLG